jgi:hypothetical protein
LTVTFDEFSEIDPKIFGSIANQNAKSFSREKPDDGSVRTMISVLNESMDRQAERLEKCIERNFLANRADLIAQTKTVAERIDRKT